MTTLEKAIDLLKVPDTDDGSRTAQETAMSECFGASSGIAGYGISFNRVRRNLIRLKSTFENRRNKN